MVTLITLAESKLENLFSQQVRPRPGSSTATATVETRPRRAAVISRPILAASAGWEEELQLADDAAA
jgi:hypothetical protein